MTFNGSSLPSPLPFARSQVVEVKTDILLTSLISAPHSVSFQISSQSHVSALFSGGFHFIDFNFPFLLSCQLNWNCGPTHCHDFNCQFKTESIIPSNADPTTCGCASAEQVIPPPPDKGHPKLAYKLKPQEQEALLQSSG